MNNTIVIKNLTVKNRWAFLFALFVCSIFLMGCPYYSTYTIDTNPQNQVNNQYLGKWQGALIDEQGEKKNVKLDISKIDDYYYEFLFHGQFFTKKKKTKSCFIKRLFNKSKKNEPLEDTICCSAFVSYVSNREIMNINLKGVNYYAEVLFENDLLTLLPISENFSSKVILSDMELREALEFHYKSRLFPYYDEPFCLRSMKKISE